MISIVKNEKNEFDFETQLSPLDKVGPSTVNSDDMKDQMGVTTRAKNSAETRMVNDTSQGAPSNHKEEVTIVNSLKLNPIVANGFGKHEEETMLDAELDSSRGLANGLESRKEIEEEAVAPCHLILDERVQSLIDLLEETSCDSIEEENYRRKLSKSEETECARSVKTSGDLEVQAKNSNSDSRTPQFAASTIAKENKSSSVDSRFRKGSSSDIVRPHSDSDAVPNIAQSGAADSDVTVRRRKVLKTRGGHMVRSKSVHGVHGLRNLLDPDKLSFVEECEWLDNLVQVELETIKRRKLEEAMQSPKVEHEKPPQLFTRDETIDENSLNLGDSRKLVKSLLDMEVELREEKELYAKRKEQLGERDRHVLERSKSMPVSQGTLLESEARMFSERGVSVDSNIPLEAETNANENEVVSENQNSDLENVIAPSDIKSSIDNSKNESNDNVGANRMRGDSFNEAKVSPLHKKHTSDCKKEEANDLSHVSPVPNFAAHIDNTKEDKLKSVPKTDCKMEKSGNAAVQELSHQPEFEEHKHLKHIRAFKEIFEGKSAPVRPIDNYQKSLSMEVRPLGFGLSRSKSLGDGLNRPSDDSFHIQVFEKQSSFDNGIKRRESTGNKDKDVVFYEEAMMEMRRRKNGQDTKTNQEKVLVDDMVPKSVEDDAKVSTSEEEATPVFKKVGDFKQMFEGEKTRKEAISKKKVAIVKQSELKQESHNGERTEPAEVKSLKYNKKNSIENVKNGKLNTGDDTAKPVKPKGKSLDDICSTKNTEMKLEDDSVEDGIPSIKDRLLLFQSTNVERDEVKQRSKEIRKIRPKSFHGDGSVLRSTNTDDFPAVDSELESLRYAGHIKSPKKQFINDLGECMINNEDHSSGHVAKVSSKKQIVMHSTETEDETSKTVSFSRNFQDNAERNQAKPMQRNSGEEFSYVKIVKDDRIRRELQEQEAREAEMKTRMATNLSSVAEPNGTVKGEEMMEDPSVKLDNHEGKLVNSQLKSTTGNEGEKKKVATEVKRDSLQKHRLTGKVVKVDRFPEGTLEDYARNSQNMKDIGKEMDLRDLGEMKDSNGNLVSKHAAPNSVTQRDERGSIKVGRHATT